MRNVGGSFYDFVAEHYAGTERHLLTDAAEPWGGYAAAAWARQLAADCRFDPAAEQLVDVAQVLDRIYAG